MSRSSQNDAGMSEDSTFKSLFDLTSKSANETYEVRLCSWKFVKLWPSNCLEIAGARRQYVSARESQRCWRERWRRGRRTGYSGISTNANLSPLAHDVSLRG